MRGNRRDEPVSIRTYVEQGLAVLNGLPALVVDLDDLPRRLRLDLVHELHGFDDAEHLAHPHAVAHVDEGRRAGIGRTIEGAHDRALHRDEAELLGGGGGRGGGGRHRRRRKGDVEGGGDHGVNEGDGRRRGGRVVGGGGGL